MFIANGSLISWRSKKQTPVVHSTWEAQYIPVSYSVRQCIWIRTLYNEPLSHELGGPTVIYCNNPEALFLAKNEVMNERTKHIDTKSHFIRKQIGLGAVALQISQYRRNAGRRFYEGTGKSETF